MEKRYKILFFIFTAVNILFFLNKGIIAKGPHTETATYAGSDDEIGANVCKACHLSHGAKGENRLWPVGTKGGDTSFVDTTGATMIQNLCVYCHWENGAQPGPGGFLVGRYGAHTLVRAHGRNMTPYESGGVNLFGPGHLYRHGAENAPLRNAALGDTVRTRDNDSTIQGYGAKYGRYNRNGFELMAKEADTSGDYSLASRLSCFSCHNPHEDFLAAGQNYISRGTSTTDTYDFSQAMNYIREYVGDEGTDLNPTHYNSVGTNTANIYIGRTRLVCLSCHYGGMEPPLTDPYGPLGIESATIIDNLIPPYPKRGIPQHHDRISKCGDCHGVWDYPIVSKCGACHGNPPVANPLLDKHYPNDVYYNTLFTAFTISGVGAHETHFYLEGYTKGTLTYKCQTCHPYGSVTHINDTLEVVFDTLYFPAGTRLNVPYNSCIVTGTGTNKRIECVVGCHDPIIGETTGYPKPPPYNTVWWQNPPVGETGTVPDSSRYDWKKVYSYVTCISCHDYQGTFFKPDTAVYKNASHHPYVTTSTADSVVVERNSCALCHSGADTTVAEHQWARFDSTDSTWKAKYDTFNIYGDNKRRHAHTSYNFDTMTPPGGADLDSSLFEWNSFVFNPVLRPRFSDTAMADSTVLPTPYGFPTRFRSFPIYDEEPGRIPNEIGICDPCHDQTEFEVRYGTLMVHNPDTATIGAYSSSSIVLGTTYFRAPKAAAYFYDSAPGIGGHGQSTTQVTGHKMGDSRLSSGNDEQRIKCRSCHSYHGSTIGKILETAAMRPGDVDANKFPYGTYLPYASPAVASGNNNSFCYRCHFYKYDNGFYSSTAYELSIHGDTSVVSNFKIWADDTANHIAYAPAAGHPNSYYWKRNESTGTLDRGLCVYCHEPHGGYGWDSTVFSRPGFSSLIRGGSNDKYIDDNKYGTVVALADQNLCFKCHTYDSSWNVYSDTKWASTQYESAVYNAYDWIPRGTDVSDNFTSTMSSHRVNKSDQGQGALGPGLGRLIIECINCHNPHTVQKNQ